MIIDDNNTNLPLGTNFNSEKDAIFRIINASGNEQLNNDRNNETR